MEPNEAIRLSKQGQLHPSEMLRALVDGKLEIPLWEPPEFQYGRISGWHPVSLAKEDGSQWVVAFTTNELLSKYCEENPELQTYITVDTRWVLFALPKAHGIVFDIGSETMFQWSSVGIEKYKEDVLSSS